MYLVLQLATVICCVTLSVSEPREINDKMSLTDLQTSVIFLFIIDSVFPYRICVSVFFFCMFSPKHFLSFFTIKLYFLCAYESIF